MMFVRSPKKFNVNVCQKVPFVLACFQASAAPRPENLDSKEQDALFGLNTQITINLASKMSLLYLNSVIFFVATTFRFFTWLEPPNHANISLFSDWIVKL
jgi:hypothetical protein